MANIHTPFLFPFELLWDPVTTSAEWKFIVMLTGEHKVLQLTASKKSWRLAHVTYTYHTLRLNSINKLLQKNYTKESRLALTHMCMVIAYSQKSVQMRAVALSHASLSLYTDNGFLRNLYSSIHVVFCRPLLLSTGRVTMVREVRTTLRHDLPEIFSQ